VPVTLIASPATKNRIDRPRVTVLVINNDNGGG
jgi:hypothetical protein